MSYVFSFGMTPANILTPVLDSCVFVVVFFFLFFLLFFLFFFCLFVCLFCLFVCFLPSRATAAYSSLSFGFVGMPPNPNFP